MNPSVTLRVAMRALIKNKMRAGLTILGIVIGVAALILLVSISQSASLLVKGQFQSLGTNFLFILPGSHQDGGLNLPAGSVKTLTAADADALLAECPAIAEASPMVGAQAQVVAGHFNWSPDQLYGVNEQYVSIANRQIRKGSFFTISDIRAATKVCIIGKTVADNLFPNTDCLGATIRIKNVPFQIIGILEPKGVNLFGDDQDNIVLAPFTTITKRVSGSTYNNVDAILLSARSTDHMKEAEDEAKNLLRQRHRIRHGNKDDFNVENSSEIAKVLNVITTVMTLLLGSVASVSLVVGGVGIMNIMLVSVTERTREIGIRLAIGARSCDILWQFLLEAVVLSTLGGVLGVAFGVVAALGATSAVNHFLVGMHCPLSISVAAIVVALVFAGSVGMFFGYYPARKASRLDPIESLRYE